MTPVFHPWVEHVVKIWNFQGHHETCSLLRVRSTSARRNETGGTVMWNGDGQEKTHAIFEKVRGHQSWPLGSIYGYLGGGFKYFLFSPLFGEDEPILTNIFFRWVVQPPTRYIRYSYLPGDSIRNLSWGPVSEWKRDPNSLKGCWLLSSGLQLGYLKAHGGLNHLRIQACPKKGIIPRFLFQGLEWNPQSYSIGRGLDS